jgi:16S rRNA (cytosine1402-N4)-methyltransferase
MYSHTPVLVQSIDSMFDLAAGPFHFVDATLGEGGYAEYFLSRYPGLTYTGVDADSAILERAKVRLSGFGNRIHYFNMWFTDFFRNFRRLDLARPDRILFDLGISKYHYEKGERGFSFQVDEPLDMRLDAKTKITATEIVNTWSVGKLTDIFSEFGEETRFARVIARKIEWARQEKPIRTTFELVKVIKSALPPKVRYQRHIHPATKCFQALRIAVNNELANLKAVLETAFDALNGKGRLAVIAYHSLEDRIVKRFFREKNKACTCPENWPICQCDGEKEVNLLTRKPVMADEAEVASNPSSRSARLRICEKLNGEAENA